MLAGVDAPAFATAQPLPAAKRQQSANATAILGDFTATFTVSA
jgi:hypothetical protein